MDKIVKKTAIFFRTQKVFLLLTIVYLLFRIPFLTRLPIFNDEAIYLDWGWREVHEPGFLFYSLYDAKQPLLMWVFGISEKIFLDPLFAGRFVSVVMGSITLSGIYKVGEKLFSKNLGVIAGVFYIVVPLYSFFDRQALMESAVTAVGVWILYFSLILLEEFKERYAVYLGILFGVGFFIKSSVLVFLFSLFFIFMVLFIKERKNRKRIVKTLCIVLLTFFLFDFLLLIQPKFWETLSSNARYSLSFAELVQFPILHWLGNVAGVFEIHFFYVTPLIALLSIIGIYYLIKSKSRLHHFFVLWCIANILQLVLLTRSMSTRYVSVFLVFLIIPAAYVMYLKIESKKIVGFIMLIVGIVIPMTMTVLQVHNPIFYIQSMRKLTKYSETGYTQGYTSGLGINEIVNYFLKEYPRENIFIGIAENIGNPESAMNIYFNKHKNIKVGYFESRYLGQSLHDIECLSASTPFYYVSREDQLVGLQRYFTNIRFYNNPFSDYKIGVYKLKKDCKGKTLSIEAVKT